MAYDESLADRIRWALEESGKVFEEKQMFGGLAFMVDGKMCLGVVNDALMARVDPENYENLLEQKGARPMDFTGRPMKGFLFVDPDGIASEAELGQWVQRCLDYNPRANASKK